MKRYIVENCNIPDELKKIISIDDSMHSDSIDMKVKEIKDIVINEGMNGVIRLSQQYDDFKLSGSNFRVSKDEIDILASGIDSGLSASLEVAINRVKEFHSNQIGRGYEYIDNYNNRMGQKVIPIDSVCVYVPGGRALYPSTIYMTVIPAILAGVRRIVMISPPRTFVESPEVARLIQLLGIDEVYRVGGAQGVFCAAYGCGEFKPVDKIVGPGNIYVAKAKQMVSGKVAIDMIAGPSEILIIADSDDKNAAEVIAADLLSQAEHDPMARAIVTGKDRLVLSKIEKEVYRQANLLPDNLRANAIESLENRGIIIDALTDDDIIHAVNFIASEHLEIYSSDYNKYFDKVKNAGSIFLGKWTPESVGDYLGGPNHVLPTSSTARFYSPLGVYDFQKRISYIEFSQSSLRKYNSDITSLARSEKLEAHARSCEIRLK